MGQDRPPPARRLLLRAERPPGLQGLREAGVPVPAAVLQVPLVRWSALGGFPGAGSFITMPAGGGRGEPQSIRPHTLTRTPARNRSPRDPRAARSPPTAASRTPSSR